MKLRNGLSVQVVASAFPVDKKEFASSFILNDVLGLREAGVRSYVTTCRYGEDVDLDGIHVHRITRRNLDLPSYISRWLGMPERLLFPRSVFLQPLMNHCISKYKDEILGEVRAHSVDLIHAHFAYPDGYAAMLAKKSLKKPLVTSLHGCDILTEPSIKYGTRLKRHLDNVVSNVVAASDRVVVASKEVYSEALLVGASVERLVRIPNGVDTVRFNPGVDGSVVRRRLRLGDNPVVLFVGGLLPYKGPEYLLKAAPIVVREYPNAVFVMIGNGPLRRYLERLGEKLGVLRNIIFVGWVPPLQIPLFYAACDIFVLPSLSEGFGIATIEAMATGKPVIGTSVGGTLDIIEDGVNGYLVEPKNPVDLADKVIILLSDDERREVMARVSRRIVEEKFNIGLRVTRIANMYKSIL